MQFFRERMNSVRYITSNEENRIPVEIQLLLWYLFDTMNEEKDYLQIFDLKISDGKQLIHHYQEQPQWSEEVFLLTDNPITEKVYIITENGNETMLLAEDY